MTLAETAGHNADAGKEFNDLMRRACKAGTKAEADALIGAGYRVDPQIHQTVSLLALGHWDCHWPIGDPGEKGFGFCGKTRLPNSSYCESHDRRSKL